MDIFLEKSFNTGLAHRFYFIRSGLYRALLRLAPFLTGKLLDFGCGRKPYQTLFEVDEYIGLDFEKTGHDHSNEQIDVFYDGIRIPFEDGHFDSILCSEVAEHLFDLPAALNEMNRVLKKGGRLLLTCPFVWSEHEVPYDFARYTQYALKDMFEKSGFRIIEYSKEGNFVETITQLRILYFLEWAEPFFSRLSLLGGLLQKVIIFLMNGWGALKSRVLPVKYDLYLSNILLAEKIADENDGE